MLRMASLELKELETSQPGGYHLLEIAIGTEITILKMGRKFLYRIHSFSLLTRLATNFLSSGVFRRCSAAV